MPVDVFAPMYSNYDKAFVDYIHSVRYGERPLLCVFATPERALAQVNKHLKEGGKDVKVIPLPFCSISRTSEVFDKERFIEYRFRRIFWSDDSQKWIHMQRPMPMNITYQVHLWCRNLIDIDFLKAQILTSLRANETFIDVNHEPPLNTLMSLTTLEEINDASSYETEDRQRILRKVFVFLMRGWVCYPTSLVGRIESVNIEVWESEDLVSEDELLDEYVVE